MFAKNCEHKILKNGFWILKEFNTVHDKLFLPTSLDNQTLQRQVFWVQIIGNTETNWVMTLMFCGLYRYCSWENSSKIRIEFQLGKNMTSEVDFLCLVMLPQSFLLKIKHEKTSPGQ